MSAHYYYSNFWKIKNIGSKASLETARGLAKCTEGVKLQVTYNLVELHMILAKILQINVIKSNAA